MKCITIFDTWRPWGAPFLCSICRGEPSHRRRLSSHRRVLRNSVCLFVVPGSQYSPTRAGPIVCDAHGKCVHLRERTHNCVQCCLCGGGPIAAPAHIRNRSDNPFQSRHSFGPRSTFQSAKKTKRQDSVTTQSLPLRVRLRLRAYAPAPTPLPHPIPRSGPGQPLVHDACPRLSSAPCSAPPPPLSRSSQPQRAPDLPPPPTLPLAASPCRYKPEWPTHTTCKQSKCTKDLLLLGHIKTSAESQSSVTKIGLGINGAKHIRAARGLVVGLWSLPVTDDINGDFTALQ